MFIFKKRILESESGLFYLDKEGMLTDFKPSETNPIIKEKIEEPFAYNGYITKESISHLIIPKGVRGFADDFFRGITVTCRFELPEGLLFIGNSFHDNSSHGCVFSHCTLPDVRLPDSLKELGLFAFGCSVINYLQIPSYKAFPTKKPHKSCRDDSLNRSDEYGILKRNLSVFGRNNYVGTISVGRGVGQQLCQRHRLGLAGRHPDPRHGHSADRAHALFAGAPLRRIAEHDHHPRAEKPRQPQEEPGHAAQIRFAV